ncbi:hypothetical protein DICSQDRAFT_171091 [Dichomitus squalens LYAD-421 SS1]|uniref:Uncharacterized protein n=1 Tax=Dichomitus squalens (strain LYAD-421) TaxID=732165 RepID=R7SXB4_DICSQ|nr:uncharacterized protein DICSQDRAFT_171091 [Dichomitus squalens LYAD-421 SS1]EJF60370.1 hypothetical protein DICSQDRAFT_171091 [Dichomitus squalens LYAD-421 SS1]
MSSARSVSDATASPFNLSIPPSNAIAKPLSPEGITSTDLYLKHFAYAKLGDFATEEFSAAAQRRSALFTNQRYNSNMWSTLSREALLTLRRDSQVSSSAEASKRLHSPCLTIPRSHVAAASGTQTLHLPPGPRHAPPPRLSLQDRAVLPAPHPLCSVLPLTPPTPANVAIEMAKRAEESMCGSAPYNIGIGIYVKIPQMHGPSSSSSESPLPPPSQNNYTPRASHPSLPQLSPNSSPVKVDDSEAINSDLDDSDPDNAQEEIEGGTADWSSHPCPGSMFH